MRNLRYRCNPNNSVVHITNRTVSGLPFVGKQFMNELLAGIMAKSQENNPVQICHFIWMPNHYHLLLAGRAKAISDFICQMQSETAKMVKRLTPQYDGKVWASRFHEQRLCTEEDVLSTINYIYSNPVKAGLVSNISEWTGFSSYNMYKSDSYKLNAHWTPSRYLDPLEKEVDSANEIKPLKTLRALPSTPYELIIQPDIWKNCFTESKSWSNDYIYNRINEEIKTSEAEYASLHKNKFLGVKKLKKQSINKHYKPKKKSPTPFIICKVKELRKTFIQEYHQFCENCRKAWQKWKRGDYLAPYVFGAFRPSLPIINCLSLS